MYYIRMCVGCLCVRGEWVHVLWGLCYKVKYRQVQSALTDQTMLKTVNTKNVPTFSKVTNHIISLNIKTEKNLLKVTAYQVFGIDKT